MTPERHPTATIMEKVAALAVLTAVAVVVALVLGVILVLFLSSADYVRAGEGLPDEPVCMEAGVIIECSDLPGIAPQPDSEPTYPTDGPAPDPDPVADYGSTPGLTLPDTAMAGR